MSNPDTSRQGPAGLEAARWARIERAWWVALIVTMTVFSAFPLANLLLGLATKDYRLWYQVGQAMRLGLDIYPRPETGRLFPFMYPPSAAAMLGVVSLLGQTGTLIALVLATSLSWLASIGLSVWLAMGTGSRRHPLILIVPSMSVIVLIHNTYLLGQPNLLLLALVLGAFACLRLGRDFAAGALVATAAAIKAFPILILGYLVYRRMWKATASTVAVLAAWLLIAPLPFRSPAQTIDDLVIWSKGMLFTYNTHGIAQRPLRSYSYKNQSIMAVMHRLLRNVPADGESVLSRRMRAGQLGAQTALDPTTDLLGYLKPHHHADKPDRTAGVGAPAPMGRDTSGDPADEATTATAPAPRWDAEIQGAERALRTSWRVNFVDLEFQTVTWITLAVMLGLCLFFVAVMPPGRRRTIETDALEFALVTLLTVIFSPLSFNYAYVWLLYPTTLALHRVTSEPAGAPRHRLKVAWLAAVLLIPALAIPMPQLAQACGNLFIPAVLLVFGLGAMLRAAGRRSEPAAVPSPHLRDHAHDGSRTEVASRTPS
jgi:hypothetical protein